MAAWDFGPDPYTYERVAADLPWTGKRPVYVVRRGDRLLGVIVPVRINTDTRIAGTRLRRAGLGRDGFAAVVPNVHSFTGAKLGGFGTFIERDRRRDAAEDLEDRYRSDPDFDDAFVAASVAHYRKDPTP